MTKASAQAVPSYLREINERRVLDLLRSHGSLHAAEVARLTSLSRPTAAQVLRSLVDVGLVSEQFPSASDPRRARAMYNAVDDLGAVVSVDIGARFMRAAVGDINGHVRATVSKPMSDVQLKTVLTTMHAAVDEALAAAGFSHAQMLSLVVGSPGVVDPATDRIAIAGAVSELEGIQLGEIVAREFNCTPLIENDVNLVAIAEQAYGEGRDINNFAVLSVGSGIGAGLVLNGQLHRGHRGAAGEIFYVPLGDPTDLTHRGTDPSAPNVEALARSLAPKYPESRLTEPYEPIAIFEAARYKDSLAVAIVHNVADRIAKYIAAITAVVDVELVILGGGIGRQADVLLAETQAAVARLVPFAPRVEVSNLGDNSVLLGGIALCTAVAQDHVFAERSNAYQAAR